MLKKKNQEELDVSEIQEKILDFTILETESPKTKSGLEKESNKLQQKRLRDTKELESLKKPEEEIIKKNEEMYNSILQKIVLLDNIIMSSVAESVSNSVNKITRKYARSALQSSALQLSALQRSALQSSPLQRYVVGGKPVNKKLVNKKLVNKKPVNKKPVNKKLVNKKLVNKKPV